MNIAIFLKDLSGGGAERVMVQLANGIADRGIDVDLILAVDGGPYLSQVSPKVRVVHLHASRTLFSLWKLARYLISHRPRAVLSALVHANAVAYLANVLAGRQTRLIITEHSNPLVAGRNDPTLNARVARAIRPWIYRRADCLVAVSRGVAQGLARVCAIPEDRISVVYNPVVSPDIHKKQCLPVCHPWFIPPGDPVIISIGRLTPQKDFITLLRAFSLVRQTTGAKLMILGEGPERKNLEREIVALDLQCDVELYGFTQNPYAFLARARVFALSSASEGLPTVLIEAMACGTPVVSTDCPSGPSEILEGGRFGPLVPVGDAQALAASIMDTLQSPQDADTLRKRATDFSIERAVDNYMRLIETCCDRCDS